MLWLIGTLVVGVGAVTLGVALIATVVGAAQEVGRNARS
jgi:hypothetical protein